MRGSILPSLLSAAARNADRGFPDVALFEVGPQYLDGTPEVRAFVYGPSGDGRGEVFRGEN